MHYAWLIWSSSLLIPWALLYVSLKTGAEKRKMLIVSLWTAALGLSEPFFVPAYWSPPSLFDLAQRTGFDIESLIFAFGVGGIVALLYEWISRRESMPMPKEMRQMSSHRYHRLAILSGPAIFLVLWLTTSFNPIYSAIIALFVSGLAAWYCRPDLKARMLMSGCLFTLFYFIFFLTLILFYPEYVEQVWNLKAITGILVLGVPLEELLFAFSFGFAWSSIYEHFTWRTT